MASKILFLIAILAVLSGCAGTAQRPAREPATTAPRAAAQTTPKPDRTEALLQAIIALDTEYKYGGASHAQGFDCSGLVAYVAKTAWGYELPHNALAQSRHGDAVPFEDLQAGDLVFFNTLNRPFSHVGIYIGNGRFIHAPKMGARVRTEQLHLRYWKTRFDGARRLGQPA